MRKFQEFLESKSLQLEQAEQPGFPGASGRTSSSGGDLGLRGIGGESPLSRDPDDYDLGAQQKGDKHEERWDWLIDQSKSYKDVLNRIRDLTRAYGKGGKWTIEPERLIPKIAELIDEVLPERPQYNFRSRK